MIQVKMHPDIRRVRVSADTQCIVAYGYWFAGEVYRGAMAGTYAELHQWVDDVLFRHGPGAKGEVYFWIRDPNQIYPLLAKTGLYLKQALKQFLHYLHPGKYVQPQSVGGCKAVQALRHSQSPALREVSGYSKEKAEAVLAMLEFKHGDHLNWWSDDMMEELYKATFCYEHRSK